MLLLIIALSATALVSGGDAFGQTTPPPHQTWQPTTNTPSKTALTKTAPAKTQTTKTEPRTTQSKPHQATKEHGHSHSGGGVGVGVGVNVDLGGMGQRKAEPDPFAVGGGQPVAHTEEKPKTKKTQRSEATSDPFSHVELTGPQAKGESKP